MAAEIAFGIVDAANLGVELAVHEPLAVIKRQLEPFGFGKCRRCGDIGRFVEGIKIGQPCHEPEVG